MSKNKLIIKNSLMLDVNGVAYPNTCIVVENGVIKDIFLDDKKTDNNIYEKIIDAKGLTILPGIINAHTHAGFKLINNKKRNGFDKEYLKACIDDGITTIRDEGMFIDSSIEDVISDRKNINDANIYPRIVTTGKFFTAPGGYGGQAPIELETIDEARIKVNHVIDKGVDIIKTVLEDGIDPSTKGLPKLSDELLKVICNEAHKRGVKVSAHVTQSHNLKKLIVAGIDDAAHMIYDYLSDELIDEMVKKDVFIVPTLTVTKMISEKYGVPIFETTKDNVTRFVKAGGNIAFGDDFIDEEYPWYRLGMPAIEMELLKECGLSNLDIIKAMTKNGAVVCGLDSKVGTIQIGKKADLILIKGNPIVNLEYIRNVKIVIKDGHIVKQVLD